MGKLRNSMSGGLKVALRGAALRFLGPWVKLLLQAGVGVGEFTAWVKVAYVRAAREQGEASGRSSKPNVTRIAVLTGLTRIEVKALLQAGGQDAFESDRGRQRADRVLTGWWNDRDFKDAVGKPAVLEEKGGSRSFQTLCERYSGDPRFAAILDELIRVKAVGRLADGRLEALSRTYATVRWDPDGITALGEELAEHAAALVNNLMQPGRALFTRRVVNLQLDPRYAPMLIRDIEERAAAAAESIDDELNDRLYTVVPAGSRPAFHMAVGIYLFAAPAEELGVSEAVVPTRETSAKVSYRGKRSARRRR